MFGKVIGMQFEFFRNSEFFYGDVIPVEKLPKEDSNFWIYRVNSNSELVQRNEVTKEALSEAKNFQIIHVACLYKWEK